jgi:hypothetical protein
MFWRSFNNLTINITSFHCIVCAKETRVTCVVLSACVNRRISQWKDIWCHSLIHSFAKSFSVLHNSEHSTEVTALTAVHGYICTYEECCVRKETSLPPHCVTVDRAEPTSAPSPDINKGQASLKHFDHKSLSAAPRIEGYNNKREYRRLKTCFKQFNKSWPMT